MTYKVYLVDALADGLGNWYYNNTTYVSQFETKAKNVSKVLTKHLRTVLGVRVSSKGFKLCYDAADGSFEVRQTTDCFKDCPVIYVKPVDNESEV